MQKEYIRNKINKIPSTFNMWTNILIQKVDLLLLIYPEWENLVNILTSE